MEAHCFDNSHRDDPQCRLHLLGMEEKTCAPTRGSYFIEAVRGRQESQGLDGKVPCGVDDRDAHTVVSRQVPLHKYDRLGTLPDRRLHGGTFLLGLRQQYAPSFLGERRPIHLYSLALGLRLSMWQARAGQMGTAQLPIMVALATKNNVIECKTIGSVDLLIR